MGASCPTSYNGFEWCAPRMHAPGVWSGKSPFIDKVLLVPAGKTACPSCKTERKYDVIVAHQWPGTYQLRHSNKPARLFQEGALLGSGSELDDPVCFGQIAVDKLPDVEAFLYSEQQQK